MCVGVRWLLRFCAEPEVWVARRTGTAAADSSGAHRPAWLQSGRDWASDHLFEYVEASISRPALDAALRLDDGAWEKATTEAPGPTRAHLLTPQSFAPFQGLQNP